uniref:Uncharacterized protein n=1 Tax=Anguilla anguilla TaxID=7936 RepID=A0A0E9XUM3_ANGAN
MHTYVIVYIVLGDRLD